jgi:hypothetical protein
MIFFGHRHIIITHCLTLAYAAIRYKKYQEPVLTTLAKNRET